MYLVIESDSQKLTLNISNGGLERSSSVLHVLLRITRDRSKYNRFVKLKNNYILFSEERDCYIIIRYYPSCTFPRRVFVTEKA